ncbi:DNA/RNA nuclease SfsA [Oceanicella actignis]|uniref:Sugar fermentation stimulation protein homolog n=1 Tax=Oceanicella actignis TaxID=1189325 RepID=A0A1M7RVI9_9RHOB|nr:DNA/RNA nuclease SfsA [Oceanicella actignis]SET01952.1 sugar fermentation stimulation protein A [Oceanicella actignis]SHN50220.1 sugar fermentation stimulation protein A [Oceanicella actignis]
MDFDRPLQPARLLRRYKRFLADMRLEDGREVTVHCANPGAMTGLAEPGLRCWIEPNDDPRRKLRWSWKLVETPGGGLAGVDTSIANRVVAEALAAGAIPELAGREVRPEARLGARSRVDFALTAPGRPTLWLEVKTVSLRRRGDLAEFPDARTARGARHLDELAAAARAGDEAALLFFVQRDDAARAAVARDIDPAYAEAFDRARAAGVRVLVRRAALSRAGVALGPALPLAEAPPERADRAAAGDAL